MNRDDRKVFFHAGLIALFVMIAAAAFAEDAPPIDCAMVRAKVAEHGKLAVYAWALAHGYTPREITRIRRKCGV